VNTKTATLERSRPAWLDYLELTKPRLSLFVLVVVFIAAWMADPVHADLVLIFHAVMGTALCAGGANALNMYVERDHDAHMHRTWNRPLPAGRLRPRDVLLFGCLLSVIGTAQLLLATTPLAAAVAAANVLCYVLVYTPLKRVTTLNTHIGAVPGALPALIGWSAVTGTLTTGAAPAWMLFLIVYVWQLPHFLSIAWLYREDYARGGFRMLTVVDRDGAATGRQAVLGALALVPVSLLPAIGGVAGLLYFVGALVLGALFLLRAIAFALARTSNSARLLMRSSLLYLPLLLALMLAG